MSDGFRPMFVLNKCWEFSDKSVVLQLFSGRGGDDAAEGAGKSFLVIRLHQENCGMLLESARPPGEPKAGAISSLIRKHLLRAQITGIFTDDASTGIWLQMRHPPGSDRYWHLYLAKSHKPPFLSLINPDRVSLLRLSASATYTKAHPHGDPLPDAAAGNFQPYILSAKAARSSASPQAAAGESLEVSDQQKVLRDRLKRKLKTLRQALGKMTGKMPRAEDLARLEREALLLKEHLHLVIPGAESLVLPSELTGETGEVCIALDPQSPAGQNLQLYYTRLKKGKKAAAIQREMVTKLQDQLTALETDIVFLQENSLDVSQISEWQRRYQLLPQPSSFSAHAGAKQKSGTQPYRVFDIPHLAKILVGKGAAESDVMLKQAKANDFWMHVVNGTGTHVLIVHKTLKDPALAEKAQRAAAVLAVHYSQYRTTRSAEVYLSTRARIKKQKGMPPGLWKIERAQTLMVQYDEEELAAILGFRLA